MKEPKGNKSIKGFLLFGFLLGSMFPLIAYFIQSLENGLAFSLVNIGFLHQKTVLLYIIDLAPLVIGLLFAVIGKYYIEREQYLVEISTLEKSLRSSDHLNVQKKAIRKIRLAYTTVFLGVTLLLIALSIIVLGKIKDQQELAKFMSNIKSQLILIELKKNSVSNDIAFQNGYISDITLFMEKHHESWYSIKLKEIQTFSHTDEGLKQLVQALDGIYYRAYSDSAEQNQHILLIGIIVLLIVVVLFIYTHFFVFFPKFVELQKGILETTLIKNKLSHKSEELEAALNENKFLLSEFDKNLRNAEILQRINRKNIGTLRSVFEEVFILNKPLQILSGDFLWHEKLSSGPTLLVMGDCVGHGVSASLLSNFYFKFLEYLLPSYRNPYHLYQDLNTAINSYFAQSKHQIDTECELTILEIDTDQKSILAFSTQMEIYLMKGGSISTISFKNKNRFTTEDPNVALSYSSGDQIFIATDGLRNSFTKDTRRVSRVGIHHLLQEIADHHLMEKYGLLKDYIEDLNSNDDVLMIGIQL